MKKLALITSAFLICCTYVMAQSNNDWVKNSDALFNKGVKLYKAKKYRKAIPIFAKSDSIDKMMLDSSSNRRNYSAMWEACCYYQLGDMLKAQELHDEYDFNPVDRRLTVESDSLYTIGMRYLDRKDTTNAIKYIKLCAALEKKNIGRLSCWYGNSLSTILSYSIGKASIAECLNIEKELYDIFDTNILWGKKQQCLLQELTKSLLQVADNVDDSLTTLKYLVDYSKYCRDDSSVYGEKPFSECFLKYIGYLSLHSDNPLVPINEAEKILKLMDVDGVPDNINKYNVLMTLAALWVHGEPCHTGRYTKCPNGTPMSIEQRSHCFEYFRRASGIAKQNYGELSAEYLSLMTKMSTNFYFSCSPANTDSMKVYLHHAFDKVLADSTIIDNSNWDNIKNALLNNYIIFDELGEIAYYIALLNKLVDINSDNLCNHVDVVLKLSECYADVKDEKSIDILNKLADCIGDKESITYLYYYMKRRVMCNSRLGHYRDELKDLISIEWYMNGHDGFKPSDYSDNYSDLSYCYQMLNDTASMHTYQNKYIAALQKVIETNDGKSDSYSFSDSISDMKKIAFEYTDMHKFNESNNYYRKILNLLEQRDKTNLDAYVSYVHLYSLIASNYKYMYDFNSAKQYYDMALAADNDTLSANYYYVLQQIGKLYEDVSVEPEISLQYFLRSCELSSLRFIKRKNTLNRYEFQTEFDAARLGWERCIDVYDKLGNDSDKMKCYDKEIEFVKQTVGEESGPYRFVLREKIDDVLDKSLYDEKADRQWQKALCDSLARIIDADKEAYMYNSIAWKSAAFGDTIDAIKYYQLSIERCKVENANYANNKDYLDGTASLARLQSVDEYEKQLLKNIEITRGSKDFTCLSFISSLIDVYLEKKDTVAAEKAQMEYIKESENTNNYLYGCGVYHDLFQLLEAQNKENMIVPLYNEGSQAIRKYVKYMFNSETEEMRAARWAGYEYVPFGLGEKLYYYHPETIDVSTVYDNVMFRKNILLNSSISAVNLIRASGDTLLLKKYAKMMYLIKECDRHADIIHDGSSVITRQQAIKIIHKWDNEIMQRVSNMGGFSSSLECTWKDVQNHLKTEDMAVEFTNFKTCSDSVVYMALLLKRNMPHPIAIPMFEMRQFDKINNKDYYTTSKLANIIWKPLARFLSGTKNIYFAPSGILHKIAIEYLPADDGNNMSDKYCLYRLSSTRELVMRKEKPKQEKAVLFGGLEYTFGQKDWVDIQRTQKESDDSTLFAFRDIPSLDMRTLRTGLTFLQGTETEVNDIVICLRSKGIPVSLLTGMNGTEDSFKRLSGQNVTLMHIATHGYYQPRDTFETVEDSRLIQLFGTDHNGISAEDKSLSRSGLFFAGAADAVNDKTKINIPEGMDDGILTAKEISRLDLRSLNLLVLSACQTGQGDVTSEGVFGLQRGFKKAGAQTIIMSLWAVNDMATQILMRQFYHYLAGGMTKRMAFTKAQQYLRQTDNGKYNKPEYWAAFILLDGME
jgi:CHAT domain-containing protein